MLNSYIIKTENKLSSSQCSKRLFAFLLPNRLVPRLQMPEELGHNLYICTKTESPYTVICVCVAFWIIIYNVGVQCYGWLRNVRNSIGERAIVLKLAFQFTTVEKLLNKVSLRFQHDSYFILEAFTSKVFFYEEGINIANLFVIAKRSYHKHCHNQNDH